MRVVVVGLGYVGLPLAVRAAEAGHVVVGVDADLKKVESLRDGRSYVEDVHDLQLQAVLSSGTFCAELPWDDPAQVKFDCESSSAGGYDIAIIAVPTPLKGRVPDLSYVVSATRMLGTALRRGATVVLESTTYPGTTEGLVADNLAEVSGLLPGQDFHLGFSPERIDPGNKRMTLRNTPKLISATTRDGLARVEAFYSTIVDDVVKVSSPAVAELAKIFENTQAYVNIALINELAEVCNDLGINVHEMLDAAMTKGHSMATNGRPQDNQPWTPGPGVGGHCLPIDPMYLAWLTRSQLGRPFRFAELAEDINEGRPYTVVGRARDLLNEMRLPVKGTEILILGVAYKPNVGDLRESPAIPIVEELVRQGARVTVVDPHVTDWTLTPTASLDELFHELKPFQLAIVITDHREFDFEKLSMLVGTVLDCRNVVPDAENVVRL